jgi:hypothetical protein
VMGIFNDGDGRPYPPSAYFSLLSLTRWSAVGLWRGVELGTWGRSPSTGCGCAPARGGDVGVLDAEARLRPAWTAATCRVRSPSRSSQGKASAPHPRYRSGGLSSPSPSASPCPGPAWYLAAGKAAFRRRSRRWSVSCRNQSGREVRLPRRPVGRAGLGVPSTARPSSCGANRPDCASTG